MGNDCFGTENGKDGEVKDDPRQKLRSPAMRGDGSSGKNQESAGGDCDAMTVTVVDCGVDGASNRRGNPYLRRTTGTGGSVVEVRVEAPGTLSSYNVREASDPRNIVRSSSSSGDVRRQAYGARGRRKGA